MRVVVDRNKCQNHGQCVISAPENFDFDAEGNLEYQQGFPEDQLGDIEDAADACPVQAIEWSAAND